MESYSSKSVNIKYIALCVKLLMIA